MYVEQKKFGQLYISPRSFTNKKFKFFETFFIFFPQFQNFKSENSTSKNDRCKKINGRKSAPKYLTITLRVRKNFIQAFNSYRNS